MHSTATSIRHSEVRRPAASAVATALRATGRGW
jgi:hypothetical protein